MEKVEGIGGHRFQTQDRNRIRVQSCSRPETIYSLDSFSLLLVFNGAWKICVHSKGKLFESSRLVV